MICERCSGTTLRRTVTKQHWLNARLYIVENVEAEVCSQCGERYFHAATLTEIDRLLESDHEVRRRLSVEVVPMRYE
jgi:YgiT-type zinc finger domain-containing protein